MDVVDRILCRFVEKQRNESCCPFDVVERDALRRQGVVAVVEKGLFGALFVEHIAGPRLQPLRIYVQLLNYYVPVAFRKRGLPGLDHR